MDQAGLGKEFSRALLCWVLVVLLPGATLAADAPGGVVYGTGSVYLDGSQLANSMPVTTGSVVETKDMSIAHVDMNGSTAMLQANSIVRLKEGGIALDRGSVAMATGKSLKVFARDFEITPTTGDWTQFEVERTGGLIHISALKNDVEIKCGAQAPTVIREGHDLKRADAQNCGLAAKDSEGAPAAEKGPLLLSPWAYGIGLGAAGAILGWTLTHGSNPISPDAP